MQAVGTDAPHLLGIRSNVIPRYAHQVYDCSPHEYQSGFSIELIAIDCLVEYRQNRNYAINLPRVHGVSPWPIGGRYAVIPALSSPSQFALAQTVDAGRPACDTSSMRDWQQVVKEIRDRGYTVAEIAGECGSTRNTVSDIAHGDTQEPRHALGEELLKMRKRVTRRPPPTD